MFSTKPRLAIVIPCYNESEVLAVTITTLLNLLKQLHAICSQDSYVVFVDDGSHDDTWEQIQQASRAHSQVLGIRLVQNVGTQAAILAGLEYVTDRCDLALTTDADLQDDLNTVQQMVEQAKEGKEIVLGVRECRKIDSFFKRVTANLFYDVMVMLGIPLTKNHSDFRLMTSSVLKRLRQFHESNLFLRGFINRLSRNVGVVTYVRQQRIAGETKWSTKRLILFAWTGITSFSVVPLRFILCMGIVVFLGSISLALFSLVCKLMGQTIPGWASITVPLYTLGGLLMISLGIVGEYVGKIYEEVKRRPRYFIDSTTTSEESRD
ncbi:MAG: hypothetical protein A2Y14_01480 [Verrucomicrobia bacterium GWF2_51_19]|nr:MAG: hypothetical protein A2Y14_01480 [Verrucomicrobia bacterium GWF2_51_19]